MAKKVWAGFWKDTGRKVAAHQKRRIQGWFTTHPTTFLLSWGFVAGSAATYRGIRRLAGKPVKKKSSANTTKTVTVITSTTTTSTGGARPRYASPTKATVHAIVNAQRHAIFVTNLNDQGDSFMDNRLADLKRHPMGRAFVAVSEAIDAFRPVGNYEVSSIRDLVTDLQVALQQVSAGLDMFADAMMDAKLDRSVLNSLYEAVDASESMAARLLVARNRINGYYAHRISQEESRAGVVQALPVVANGEGVPAGIVPTGVRLAAQYAQFTPVLDEEATSIMDVIKTSQAGYAVVGGSLTGLAEKMVFPWRLEKKTNEKTNNAGIAGYEVADAFVKARKTMGRLYADQIAQEATGTPTVINIPLAS
jgi:hypothetical protein